MATNQDSTFTTPLGLLNLRQASEGDATAIATVHMQSWQETYSGLLPEQVVRRKVGRLGESTWKALLRGGRHHTCAFGVFDEEGYCRGFASGGPARGEEGRETAETYTLYVLRIAQRMALGRRLMDAVHGHFRSGGYCDATVWVLAGNTPACLFYESIGGRRDGGQTDTLLGHRVQELRYRFDLRERPSPELPGG